MPATKKWPKPKETETKRKNRVEFRAEEAVRKAAEAETAPETLEYNEDDLLASLCQDSLYKFVRTFWDVAVKDKPVWNWHIEALCRELQEMAERVFLGLPKLGDLIINISPGTTKSTIVSVMFPAWVWTRMPIARIISSSYSHSLAATMSRKSRDVVLSDLYQRLFPEIKLRGDQDAKSHYINTLGGERYATGVGGAILGNHAHFIIVDDPLDPRQAASSVELENANVFMDETLASRKTDKEVTLTILIMQRLHENDPTGSRLEKAARIPVRHICLPAELTDDVKPVEYRAYYVDGLLDPRRLGNAALEEAEARGEYYYASQFLQTPIPRGGAMFIVAKLGEPRVPPPRMVRTVRFWDKAGTCFVAGTMVTTTKGDKRIEAVRRGDKVMTRKGPRKVLWAGVANEVCDLLSLKLANGVTLTGTPDHRIWVENRGWLTLNRLQRSCYDPEAQSGELAWEGSERLPTLSSSTASGSLERSGTIKHGGGTKERESTSLTPFIEQSTASITGKSPRGSTFITRTKIQKTTPSRISNSSPSRNTRDCMTLSESGIKLRKLRSSGNLTSEKVLRPSPPGQCSTIVAKCAGTPLSHATLTRSDSSTAAKCAEPRPHTRDENFVRLRREDGGLDLIKVESVETVTLSTPVKVYDLTVEGEHEFYANAILVHNCGGGTFTAGMKMGIDETGRYWFLDMKRVQYDSGRREQLIQRTAVEDGKKTRIGVEQESNSGGKQSAEGTVRNLSGFAVTVVKVGRSDGDKSERADALSSQVNIGNVSIAIGHWNADFLHELRFFPRSKYKDQVDAAAGAFNMLAGRRRRIGGGSLLRH